VANIVDFAMICSPNKSRNAHRNAVSLFFFYIYVHEAVHELTDVAWRATVSSYGTDWIKRCQESG